MSRALGGGVSPPVSRDRRRPVQRTGGEGARRRGGSLAVSVGTEGQLSEIQRSRLLAAAVSVIDEFGYGQATVAQITARARVSRRTFYELFNNREECLTALIEEVVAMVQAELLAAKLDDLPWRERVREGLAVILAFLDREPGLAQVCVVQVLRGGSPVLECREQILTRLAAVLEEGARVRARGPEYGELTAEGLIGAAHGIVYARLSRRDSRPLTELVGELMGMVVLPYLGPAAARRELTRPLPVPAPIVWGSRSGARSARDPLQEVPMRLTYRTARVLSCIAAQPGINNRGVADQAGVADQGQISKLLARLERLGLIVNSGAGHAQGEPNAWKLTALGREVAQRLKLREEQSEETT